VILNNENRAVSLEGHAPTDLHYTVLDYREEIDFVCAPVLFVEATRTPRHRVTIGHYQTVLPLDWHMLVADRDFGIADIVTVREAIERSFDVLVSNPWNGALPQYLPIRSLGPARRFVSPKIGKRQLIAQPLDQSSCPPCVFVAREALYFSPIDIADLLS
jgi:hypothetical protein